MKRYLIALVGLFAVNAQAQSATCTASVGGAFPPAQKVALCKTFGSAIAQSMIPGTASTYNLGSLTYPWSALYTTGAVNHGTVTITPAATPVVAANFLLSGRLNIFPTAAANDAALIPQAASVGDVFRACNSGPNAVRVKAEGTPGINGAAAGTYIALATQQCATITKESASILRVNDLSTVPTPAGP